MIATSPTFSRTKKMFPRVRKYCEPLLPYTIVAMKSRTSAPSHRSTERRRSTTGAPPRARAQGRCDPDRDEPVERDRAEQERSGDGRAPRRRDVEHHECAVDRVQEQRSERGAEHGAASAEDR